MQPVPGTITDPAMDKFLRQAADNIRDDSRPLTLSTYQERAATTADFPRVYTEDQVKEIVADVIEPFIETQEDAAFMLGRVEQALDKRETEFSRLVYPVLGLVGEAAELANKLKKVARDQKGIPTEDQLAGLSDELGDVLWYEAAVADGLDKDLGYVARQNLDKLASRKDRGTIHGDGDNR